ncbi:hypothetical protein B7P43_G07646 [Cryptotermes secundus]|uniref:DNA (cytosine-5-)-methyltransferase n=2 Tax=Cryptotermes secundus TaxID=105785 RepID=A0A2J7R308_9NEOP|nr:DNA (cytosine-5)-methyltransferase 3A isoform X2 [Cryptotermes secundus]PNF35204.1 hypothetical protein B7P43_G07646 [Cryptotermes secundus]
MAPMRNKWKKTAIQRLPTSGEPFDGPVGSLVWGRIPGQPWWPGITVDGQDCGMPDISSDHKWVFWLEDRRVSKVQSKWVQHFKDRYSLYFDSTRKGKIYESAVVQAIKVYAKHLGHESGKWTNKQALKWADGGFQQNGVRKVEGVTPVPLSHVIQDDLQLIRKCVERSKQNNGSSPIKNSVQHGKQNNEPSRKRRSSISSVSELKTDVQYDDLAKVKSGEMSIRRLCLGCKSAEVKIVGEHPYFEGSLCKICMEALKKHCFEFGDDGIHTHCAICSRAGRVYVCDRPGCCKVYCTPCIEVLAAEGAKMLIEKMQPWQCFLCSDVRPTVNGIITPRHESVILSRITALFSLDKIPLFCGDDLPLSEDGLPLVSSNRKNGLRVLSLFDGISTGLFALDKLQIEVEKYYASEVDGDAINVSKLNFKDKIEYVGPVETLNLRKLKALGRIDLLLGGSPCTELSLANPVRKGLFDTDASGSLFFEYFRVLVTLRMLQGNCMYWLFENTAAMPCSMKATISRYLGRNPTVFDAAWLSAQHRTRLFWGNIPGWGKKVAKCNVKLDDCLIPGLNRIAAVDMIRTVTTNSNSLRQGKTMTHPVRMNGKEDTLWITELERVFGFETHYTDTGNLGISKRQQLLGRAWSVHVAVHLMKPLQSVFKKRNTKQGYRRVII